jgi:hypothetical protein
LIANAFFLPRHLLPEREQKPLGAIDNILGTQNRS